VIFFLLGGITLSIVQVVRDALFGVVVGRTTC